MPNAKPPRNLTPVLCQRLQAEMLKACEAVAARHGLVVEPRDITGVDLRWGFDATFRVSIPLPDGSALDPDRLRFEALAETFGLSPTDYGRQFSTGREQFRITGIDPRRPKYPVSVVRIPDGQGFKFTVDQVALLLQQGGEGCHAKGAAIARTWSEAADCCIWLFSDSGVIWPLAHLWARHLGKILVGFGEAARTLID